MNETIFADPYMEKCTECGKKVIVSIANNGVSHVISISVQCSECLVITDEYKKIKPDLAKEIEEWISS